MRTVVVLVTTLPYFYNHHSVWNIMGAQEMFIERINRCHILPRLENCLSWAISRVHVRVGMSHFFEFAQVVLSLLCVP